MKKMYPVFFLVLLPILLMSVTQSNLLKKNRIYSVNDFLVPLIDNTINPISRDGNWRLHKEYHPIYNNNGELIPDELKTYYYSAYNPDRNDSTVVSLYAGSDIWIRTDRLMFDYYAVDENLSDASDYYVPENIIRSKVEGIYNEAGNLTDMIKYSYYDDRVLHPVTHTIVNYYVNHISSYVTHYESGYYPASFRIRKNLITDGAGRVISEEEKETEDLVTWYDSNRIFYSYHEDDTSNGLDYTNFIKHNYVRKTFDNIMGEYVVMQTGMLSSVQKQYVEEGAWVDEARFLYDYDNQDRVVTITVQTAPGLNTYWFNLYRQNYHYDVNGNLSEMKLQSWSDTNGWGAERYGVIYEWEQFVSAVDNVVNPVSANLSVYPNPFKTEINISLQTKSKAPVNINIYNLKGQLVTSIESFKSTTINWDGKDKEGRAVCSGIYFVKASLEGKTVTRKVIRVN